MAALTPRVDDQSSVDYDSSSSSITVPGSSRSWMRSNQSFGSQRSSISEASSFFSSGKPHKSNQATWQAIRRLQAARGQVGLDQFRLLRRVGNGDIGNVYLCQIRNPMVGLPQCLYAMKVVDREALAIRNKEQRADMEKEILRMLDHPFLPTLYADFEASNYSCLVMEYCPGGDLYAARQRQPRRRFPILSAKFYAAEVLLALEYLHMMGIVYRDLKPENVLVREDGHIMLSDFDLSLKCDVVPELLRTKTLSPTNTNLATTTTSTRVYHQDNEEEEEEEETCFTPTCSTPIRPVLSCLRRHRKTGGVTKIIRERADDGPITTTMNSTTTQFDAEMVAEPTNARSKSFVGTHEYLAPEVISGQGHGSAVDWWTLGVFLYEMLYGRTPFKGENNERTLVNILNQPLTFPRIDVSSSKEFEELVRVQDLIAGLLVKNPKRRIGSLKGSVEIKRHEFFRGVNWALIRSVRPPEVPSDNYCKFRTSLGGAHIPKLTKKERQEPYQIPAHHFDYF